MGKRQKFEKLQKKEGRKMFIEECFLGTFYVIQRVTNNWKDKFDLIKNDPNAFKFEYTALALWLTIQRIANITDDLKLQSDLIDAIHNKYYSSLKEKPENKEIRKLLGIKYHDVLQEMVNKLNLRYRTYDECLPLTEGNNYFKLCKSFGGYIDSYHKTNFGTEIKSIMYILELIKTFFSLTDPIYDKYGK